MQPQADKRALLVVFLTVFIDLLGFGMVIPLLPIYAKLFTHDTSGQTIGLLMASFSAMQFLFAPLWGRLSDRYGRRPVLIVGLAGSVLCYSLFGIASSARSLLLLFISRIGAGICGATIPTAQAYIADVTPPESRAKGMALIGAAFGMGFTFGPLIGAAALLGSGETGAPRPAVHVSEGQMTADSFAEEAPPANLPHPATAASPWPGYLAAALSAGALLLAAFYLPESLRPGSKAAGHALFDPGALGAALSIPSMGLLLLTSFFTVLSFANLESTMSLLLQDGRGKFNLSFEGVLLVFAYIGLVLSIAQGVVVRRVAGRMPEARMAFVGGVFTIIGYALVPAVYYSGNLPLLLFALLIEVAGFAFLPTAINSLISRRSDPAKQGGILGINQSFTSLARILGPYIGIRLFFAEPTLPFWTAAGLMTLALVLMSIAARGGRDFAPGVDAA